MSRIRVLVGTRKGAFILTSDAARRDWQVSGPHFGGWEIFHVAGSPAKPDRLYASQTSSWFGQVIQRSDDGGATWNPVGNDFRYAGDAGTHLYYDGTEKPWTFKRVWHLEPSPTDADTVYAGVEDAALFRSTDGGQSWQALRQGLPQRGCFFTVLRQAMAGDAREPAGIYFGTNSGSIFASLDEGDSWEEIARHLPTILAVEVLDRPRPGL